MSFHYLSPLLLPILPRTAGTTLMNLHVENLLADTAPAGGDATLTVHIETFVDGKEVNREEVVINVRDGKPDLTYLSREFTADSLGYAQVNISADREYFRRLHSESVYMVVRRPDDGTLIVIAAPKYADPRIIDLVGRVGRFCLSHPAGYVNEKQNIGNSTLIINPFDGPILATMATANGKQLKKKIPPKSAALIPLQELIPDDALTAVLYTGNNRYPAWDVRHAYDDATRINRMDHMEMFRGSPTMMRMGAKAFVASKLRRVTRRLGLRT